jgi:predicted nuclease with TOPRIM domain
MLQTEQPPQGNIQEIEQTEQTPQGNIQENTQPSLEHLTEQFFKNYEVEMAQVLGNLGTSITKDTSRSEAPISSSNPIVDLPDTEMPFPEDEEQEEPHNEVNIPIEQAEHIEEEKEQLLTDQDEGYPDISQKQKIVGKGHYRIKKLKQENKLLRRRVKRIKVLKKKVGKLKEIIKELRKQLELADKAYERKKTKRPRTQGRNPLPRRTVHTSSIGTQTEFPVPEETTEMEPQAEIPAAEEATVQNEEVTPLEEHEVEPQTGAPTVEETSAQPEELLPTNFLAPLETIDADAQTDSPTTEDAVVQTEGVFQSHEQNAIIDRLETELVQTQKTLTQCRSEMVTMEEYQKVVKQLKTMSATENETFAELTRAQGKIKKVQNQLEKDLEKIKEICDVYTDAIDCRAPATNYTLFLLERYLLLRVKSIRAGKPIKFTTVSEFVPCFREQEEKVKYFLCEFTSITSSWKITGKRTLVLLLGTYSSKHFFLHQKPNQMGKST